MIPYGRQDISSSDLETLKQVLLSDFLTQGPQVPLFESNICKATDASFAVAGNSATSMLHLACLALGVKEGDLVWTSPITFVASANCARYCGADVDFIDVDAHTANLSIDALAMKLVAAEKAGRLPKVIIPVHMAGHSCDMQALSELVRPYGIKIIEDAAHAIGGRYQGRPIGCCEYSDICVFSFHPVKIITTGEGGVATTNDPALAKTIASLRSHGISKLPQELTRPEEGDWYYEQDTLGFNYRMTDLQAGLGNSQIQRLQEFVKRRNELVQRYHLFLSALDIEFIRPSEQCLSAYHLFIIRLPKELDRKLVFNAMRAAGIGVHVHYIPVYLQPYYTGLGFNQGHCPEAESYYASCLTLPLYPTLTDSEQDYVIETLAAVLDKVKRDR
ncbi:UDP-4-amino-4, 6-dideoxy-N-acetyl-beta-L-altrosamine transaminase [Shewanella loihica]|uniref:DegT/DnrJ/EryC1/StrS aminotransferase n=1 Tax=Shewanella loihica (strain ATCC BAA-1088 / PV-4) TaxID=323850 RepID=A3QCJ0_SHELP|nr:UDP-4-amino-4,6-dideoxy-N-acetyl-beta-L-altrosamine transaminase [Shewanella loihica]ABO23188.1 DegT/DnrJ/EryC1/StrS aminotransferase [Shewanella loihica PV-4]